MLVCVCVCVSIVTTIIQCWYLLLTDRRCCWTQRAVGGSISREVHLLPQARNSQRVRAQTREWTTRHNLHCYVILFAFCVSIWRVCRTRRWKSFRRQANASARQLSAWSTPVAAKKTNCGWRSTSRRTFSTCSATTFVLRFSTFCTLSFCFS